MAGIARTRGSNWVTSWRLALVRMTESGIPCASVRRWCFEPGRRRSVGFGPVLFPLPGPGSKSCRPRRERNRSDRPREASTTAPGAAGPTPWLVAKLSAVANTCSPNPHPISCGSICQGMPERSTKVIPVSAARSATPGCRPGFFLRRRLGAGRSGSIMFHNSSSISGLGIAPLK